MARILGLELGEHTIRGTLLRTALRKAEVIRYLEVPLAAPEDASDPAGLAEARRVAVEAVVAACDPAPDQVIVALDGREASLRAVELPAAAARRAAEVLPFELEPLLPFPAEDAVLDHQVIEQDGLTLRLLAGAVQRPRVAQLLAGLAEAGVDPREIAIGAASLDGLGALAPALDEGVALLVHVSDGVANVCVTLRGQAAYGRTLAVAGEWLREGSPFESELRRSLAAWRAAGGDPIERAWISGELPAAPAVEPAGPAAAGSTAAGSDPGAGDPGAGDDEAPAPTPSRAPPPPDPAAAWLHRVAGVPAERVRLPRGDGAPAEHLARFALSAALAARTAEKRKRFDLRRGEFAYTATGSAVHRYARTVALGVGAVLAAFAFATFAEWRVLSSEHDALAAELDRVSAAAFGQGTTSPSRARELLSRGARIDDPIPEVDAWDLLEFVSGAVPEEVAHSTRTFLVELDDEGGDGRFELVGSVASIAERDAIAQAVEAHGCLKDLERGSTSAEPGGDSRLRYQLEAEIRCGDDEEQDDRRSRRGRR